MGEARRGEAIGSAARGGTHQALRDCAPCQAPRTPQRLVHVLSEDSKHAVDTKAPQLCQARQPALARLQVLVVPGEQLDGIHEVPRVRALARSRALLPKAVHRGAEPAPKVTQAFLVNLPPVAVRARVRACARACVRGRCEVRPAARRCARVRACAGAGGQLSRRSVRRPSQQTSTPTETHTLSDMIAPGTIRGLPPLAGNGVFRAVCDRILHCRGFYSAAQVFLAFWLARSCSLEELLADASPHCSGSCTP